MNRKYNFTFSVEEDDDGRWSAWLNAIPWCITFGDTREEAVQELHDAATVVIQHLVESGEEVPVDEQFEVVV